ncbi:MAG: hypothetical protein U0Q18_22185 [Bryobacteraceae bacterium]
MKRLLPLILCLALPVIGSSVDLDKLADLVGYTIVAATNVKGTFNGADYDKLVALDNGWIFEFRSYGYHYAFHPQALVGDSDDVDQSFRSDADQSGAKRRRALSV